MNSLLLEKDGDVMVFGVGSSLVEDKRQVVVVGSGRGRYNGAIHALAPNNNGGRKTRALIMACW